MASNTRIRTCLLISLHDPSLWLFVPNSKPRKVFPLNVTFCITKWKVISVVLTSTKTTQTVLCYEPLTNTNYDPNLMHDTMPTSIGIVVGNGKSRLGINLEHLYTNKLNNYNNITVYGCNNIYKDYSPDVLITVDNRIEDDVITSNYLHCHYTPSTLTKSFPKCNVDNDSGTRAICVADHYGNHDVIFLLGFDFNTTHSAKINNIYRNEFDKRGENFSEVSIAEAYVENLNKRTKFVRVMDNEYSKKTKYSLSTITVDEFLKITL